MDMGQRRGHDRGRKGGEGKGSDAELPGTSGSPATEGLSASAPSLSALIRRVARRLTAGQLTLACAESCTGGLFAHRCTALPGASGWFLGGVVAYSNEAKSSLLNVPGYLLGRYGAVSRPVALAMARGALEAFRSDYALAVTGIAGPGGGTPRKPVGTVWIALASANAPPVAVLLHLAGTRRAIQAASSAALARLLLDALPSARGKPHGIPPVSGTMALES